MWKLKPFGYSNGAYKKSIVYTFPQKENKGTTQI